MRLNARARRLQPSSVRAVIFDWDGTLLDSYNADTSAYREMFRALGINWGARELRKHYSPNWHRVYRAAGIPARRWEEADRLWQHHYQRHSPDLMPGARQVLKRLAHHYILALVTSGNRKRVRGQLRRLGLTRLFAATVCAEDARHRKPHPAPLKVALQQLELSPKLCAYVGDSPEDIEMARRAGVRAVAVLGPFPNRRRLRAAGADALLNSLKQLPDLLAIR